MKTFLLALSFIAGSMTASAQWGRAADYSAGPGLKDAYKDYFTVGVAVNQRNVSDEAQMAIIKKQYNSVTAENDWKPGMIHPKEGVWNFERADKIANFCRENGIKMRGHCLCWHSQFADWMFVDKKGKPVKKEVFYERLREHIHTVVNRYKDVVYAWDVVNEAITDDPRVKNPFRQSRLYKICGDDFIRTAFQAAREADPNALLFYNDYNECDSVKSRRIYEVVKAMKEDGVPIDGIGMQGHYNIYGPSEEQVDKALQLYKSIVEHVHVTELDVRMNRDMGGQLDFKRDSTEMSEKLVRQQERQYAALFRVFRKHADVIDCVTFWNLSDRDSWLGARNYPLLFDEHYQKKNAYHVVVNMTEP